MRLNHLAATVAASLFAMTANANVIGFDNGESNSYTSFSATDPGSWGPGDWFGWGARGAWPQAAGMPFALADDTVNDISGNGTGAPFPTDSVGIVDSTYAPDNQFFGVVDTVNGNNPDGTATALWTFDIAGYQDLGISIDFAAMGDFEASDMFLFSASIDGGPAQTLFESVYEGALSQNYTMESGANVNLNDPLSLQGTLLNDLLATFSASIAGTGSVLEISLLTEFNGGSEAFMFDNLTVTGVAEPGIVLLLGTGLLTLALTRRRRRH
ncbi:MAG: PEP-CTERM sorting domain-containing protein [Gammaproteobacteria bacterium]|nr:PEP-CTERM sorting domain-containing protein [Gammaproteobacteria bacterium]